MTRDSGGTIVRLKKEPHAQQMKAIEADAPEQLYGGAKRGGKTIWLCQKAFLLNFWFPGNRGLMTRYNFTDLQDSTLVEFFETVPSEFIAAHNKGERTIFIKNPHPDSGKKDAGTKDGFSAWTSRQHYRGLGDQDDFEKVKGMNLGHEEYDEPSEIPFETYLMLRAQLTWTLPDGTRPPYMCLLASNPEPGWVEDRFIVNDTPGCVFIPALPSDNPYLPPGYVKELLDTYPEEWVRKYVLGGWGASEGAVFKEFTDELHNLDNWLDPTSDDEVVKFSLQLRLLEGFDHGDTGTTCLLVGGKDRAGNLFFFDEYYRKDRLVGDHAIDILALKQRFERGTYHVPIHPQRRTEFIIADPSIFRKSQHRSNEMQSIAQLYQEKGVNMIPGWNAMEMSIERIKEHLHPLDKHFHPFTGKPGSPSLFISRTRCPNLWKEMRGWKRARKSPKSSDQDGQMIYRGPDHAIDPMRYIVNAQPRRAEFCEADMSGMTEVEKWASRTHAKWASKFGKVNNPNRITGLFK
jgi:hypothetical protein